MTNPSNSLKTIALLLMAFPALLMCASCDRGHDATQSKTRIDKLRALPYTGTAADLDRDELGTVYIDRELSCPGYNLISLYRMSQAALFDADGNTVRTWDLSPSRRWSHCKLLPNGDLVVLGADHTTPRQPHVSAKARYFARFNWEGKLISKHSAPVHHDFEMLDNSNLLTLTFDSRIVPQIHRTIKTRDDAITELSPEGKVVSRISLYDAFRKATDGFKFQEVTPKDWGNSKIVDLFHSNSLETMHRKELADRNPLYALDNVLICVRHQDVIAMISRSTGKAIWTWGQGEISGPHDATVLDNGNFLLFDNGLGRDWSRVIELDPLKKKIVWEYHAPNKTDFYTKSRGSSQRLPNGNTLIAESASGHAFEVTPGNEIVWDYYSPYSNEIVNRSSIVRIRRYPLEYIEAIKTRTDDP